jgi:hypothetical protein
MELGDGGAQLGQAAHGQVLLAVGVLAEGLDDGGRDGEGGLAEAELVDGVTGGDQGVAVLVDGDGRGGDACRGR